MKVYNNTNILFLIVFLLIVILTLLILIASRILRKPQPPSKYQLPQSNTQSQCSKDTCSAIDPVNSPDYNQKQIIKQSILLEEHIAEKNKYCISCCVKHFNHIIGLAEEGIWLAGRDLSKYPLLEDSAIFYTSCFEKWLAGRNDEDIKKEVLSILRERRRQLIDIYYLS